VALQGTVADVLAFHPDGAHLLGEQGELDAAAEPFVSVSAVICKDDRSRLHALISALWMFPVSQSMMTDT